MQKIMQDVIDIAQVEKNPAQEGRYLIMILAQK